jgi:hypothetical protein
MNEIYLIISNKIDSEGYPEPIGFVDTKEDAIFCINKLNLINIEINSESDLLNKFRNDYILINPYPNNSDKILDIPKWGSGLSGKMISDAMISERKTIIDHNEKIRIETRILIEKYQIKLNEACDKYIISRKLSKEVTDGVKVSNWDRVDNYTYKKLDKIKI